MRWGVFQFDEYGYYGAKGFAVVLLMQERRGSRDGAFFDICGCDAPKESVAMQTPDGMRGSSCVRSAVGFACPRRG